MYRKYFGHLKVVFNHSMTIEKEMEDQMWRSDTCPQSLDEYLSKSTKDDLQNIGRFYGIKMSSNMKKGDIVALMSHELLTAMGNYILHMEPSQLELLVKVARNKKGYVLWEKISYEYELEHMEYFINNIMLVPIVIEGKRALTMLPEVKAIFIKKSPKGLSKILEMNYIRRQIISGMLYFYGVMLLDDIIRVYEGVIGDKLTIVQLKKDIQEIVSYDHLLSFEGGLLFDNDVLEDEIHIVLKEQLLRKAIDYKIYSAKDYYKAGISGNFLLNEHSEKLLDYFNVIFDDYEFAHETLTVVEYLFRSGAGLVEAMEFVQKIHEKPLSMKRVQTLMELLNNAYNNTLQWYLKGHTPNELFEIEKPFLKKLPNNVISFPSGARVGRNDQCPCGSGKKYKKCCGKVG